jgi:hypothetical protein
MSPVAKAEPRFDLDLQYGRKGEIQVEKVLGWITNGGLQVEVKRKRYLDLKFYVETHCDKRRNGIFEPSGINITEAQVWTFVMHDTGVHIAIPTDLLKQLVNDPSSRDAQERDGSCPTRGKLVDFCVLLYRLRQRGKPGGFPVAQPAPVAVKAEPFVPPTATDIHW